MTRSLWVLQYVLIAAGALGLGYFGLANLERLHFQATARRQFESTARRVPSDPREQPHDGELLGRVEIPRLGLSAVVIEGVTGSDLERAAGHIPGTALPGRAGNTGIAAHRDSFFRPLRRIERGDLLLLTTPGGTRGYKVVWTTVVSPKDIQVLYPTSTDSLTLITCFPFDYIGAAPKRFVVRGERVKG